MGKHKSLTELGYEYQDTVETGGHKYYIHENSGGIILIKRENTTSEELRFAITRDAYATVVADPTGYSFVRRSQLII